MKILVWGFFGKSNFGDDLFVDAFRYLFPEHNFIFTDEIKLSNLNGVDAVFLGGGSFLAETLKASPDAFAALQNMKIFYIGVGCETNIDPRHKELIKKAQLVAVRTEQNINQIKELTSNWIVIPDLVYSLPYKINSKKQSNSLLYIPNILVVPKWAEPHWKHASWNYFKSEMAQSIDQLNKEGWQIDFLPFCINNYLNDSLAAAEIINGCTANSVKKIWNKPNSFQEAIDIISLYDKAISQRFHGIILANIADVPVLTLHHHDKLKYGENTLSYYNFSKGIFLDSVKSLKKSVSSPQDLNKFEELKLKVNDALRRN